MLLAEHGGAPGLRDPGLLESALARPLQISRTQSATCRNWQPHMSLESCEPSFR